MLGTIFSRELINFTIPFIGLHSRSRNDGHLEDMTLGRYSKSKVSQEDSIYKPIGTAAATTVTPDGSNIPAIFHISQEYSILQKDDEPSHVNLALSPNNDSDDSESYVRPPGDYNFSKDDDYPIYANDGRCPPPPIPSREQRGVLNSTGSEGKGTPRSARPPKPAPRNSSSSLDSYNNKPSLSNQPSGDHIVCVAEDYHIPNK